MLDKTSAFNAIDKELLPSVLDCLQNGFLVVLIGASGTGKSVLAEKALPNAKCVSFPYNQHDFFKLKESCSTDIIVEEVCLTRALDEAIQVRDLMLEKGNFIIFTGQVWQEVKPFLTGLSSNRYKVFDLNKIWYPYGLRTPDLEPIPSEVLAN